MNRMYKLGSLERTFSGPYHLMLVQWIKAKKIKSGCVSAEVQGERKEKMTRFVEFSNFDEFQKIMCFSQASGFACKICLFLFLSVLLG